MTQPVIEEISVAEARRRQLAGAPLLDVREPDETALGLPEGAVAVPRAQLEAGPRAHHADTDAPLLLVCGSGQRSLLAAQALASQGYTRLASVAGGHAAWLAAGLPVANAPADADFMERYSRHLRLPQVGLAGQQRLERARVLLVGAGGLGSPAGYYLAAAGVGFLRVVDDDVVDRSNLQRQILHGEADIGRAKVASAAESLAALNPRTRIESVQSRVSAANIESLLADVDLVLDGSDNFPTRYLLNDACVHRGKPLVYGAVHRFEGQVSVFDAGRARGDRALLPLPVSGTAQRGRCAQLRRGRRAGRAARRDRPAAGHGGAEAAAGRWAIRWPGACCISMRWRCASARRASRPIRSARRVHRGGRSRVMSPSPNSAAPSLRGGRAPCVRARAATRPAACS